MDLYTTLPWGALCAEVEKLRIGLREGRVLEFRQLAGGACDSPCDSGSESNEKPPRKFARGLNISELRGLDLNQRPSGYEPGVAHRADGRFHCDCRGTVPACGQCRVHASPRETTRFPAILDAIWTQFSRADLRVGNPMAASTNSGGFARAFSSAIASSYSSSWIKIGTCRPRYLAISPARCTSATTEIKSSTNMAVSCGSFP